MDLSALVLSRMQFAFTVSFHIIFPAFTIGLAAWLMTLEILAFSTGKPIYRTLFDFWIRIFAVAFRLGVVSGIVMARCGPASTRRATGRRPRRPGAAYAATPKNLAVLTLATSALLRTRRLPPGARR